MAAKISWRPAAKALFRAIASAISSLRSPRVVVFYAWPDFSRKAEAIADLLERRGLPAVIMTGQSPLVRNAIAVAPDLFVGFWNDFPPVYLPRRYVFYNAEPLNVRRWKENAEWTNAMRGALQVWGYAPANEPYVAQLGVPFYYVPFGYAPYYEATFRRNTHGKALVEDVDVLFFGTLSERRRNVLRRVGELGLKHLIVSRENPLYDVELDEAIARSKIVLGIHSFDDVSTHIADFARLDHLLSNRRFVLHEELFPAGSDHSFENAVKTCPYDQLAERCAHYVNQGEERRRVANACHEWFKRERALDDFIPYDALRRELEKRP